MAANVGDFKLASTAAGFTLGFGLLTVWEAIKQTKALKSPLRSVYIYMVWGEILANLLIGVIAWLFLDGTLSPSIQLFFFILFLWVFEIQLLMQIIINRIAVVIDDRSWVAKLKYGTAAVITIVNILVFIIWIPAHLNPPPIPLFVSINIYWDRASKVIILIVDAGLNYYFLRIVKQRLVKYHGLNKYAPLVSFNARLMVVSISMDVMLIGLMSLPNQVVYVQFHPVAYMVKLNIEMSMASLIRKIAKASVDDRDMNNMHRYSLHEHTNTTNTHNGATLATFKSGNHASASAGIGKMDANNGPDDDFDGIRATTEVRIKVENVPSIDGDSVSDTGVYDGFDRRPHERTAHRAAGQRSDDELPLSPPEMGAQHVQYDVHRFKAGN